MRAPTFSEVIKSRVSGHPRFNKVSGPITLQLTLLPRTDDVVAHDTSCFALPADHPVMLLASAPWDEWPGFIRWSQMVQEAIAELEAERCNP